MWYERGAEDAEMIVQLDPWARLRRIRRTVRHFSSKEAINQPRSSSRSRDILRCSQATRFDSGIRLSLLRAKMLHGGALEYGSSKRPTTTLASLAWHPLRVYKQSRFDSGLRPHSRVASITVMHWSLKPVIRVRLSGDPRMIEV